VVRAGNFSELFAVYGLGRQHPRLHELPDAALQVPGACAVLEVHFAPR